MFLSATSQINARRSSAVGDLCKAKFFQSSKVFLLFYLLYHTRTTRKKMKTEPKTESESDAEKTRNKHTRNNLVYNFWVQFAVHRERKRVSCVRDEVESNKQFRSTFEFQLTTTSTSQCNVVETGRKQRQRQRSQQQQQQQQQLYMKTANKQQLRESELSDARMLSSLITLSLRRRSRRRKLFALRLIVMRNLPARKRRRAYL